MNTLLKSARTGAAIALLAVAGLAATSAAEAGSYRDTRLINKFIHSLDYAPSRHHYGKGWSKRFHARKHFRHHFGHKRYGYNKRHYGKRNYGRRYDRHYDHYAHAPKHYGLRLDVFFKYGSARFTYKAKRALNALGYALTSHKLGHRSFLIEGHTDAHGSDYSNRYLSERRAIAVKKYLVHNFDISPSRLIAIGYGEDRPYNYSDPYAGENRRVEIKPLPKSFTAHDFGEYRTW